MATEDEEYEEQLERVLLVQLRKDEAVNLKLSSKSMQITDAHLDLCQIMKTNGIWYIYHHVMLDYAAMSAAEPYRKCQNLAFFMRNRSGFIAARAAVRLGVADDHTAIDAAMTVLSMIDPYERIRPTDILRIMTGIEC